MHDTVAVELQEREGGPAGRRSLHERCANELGGGYLVKIQVYTPGDQWIIHHTCNALLVVLFATLIDFTPKDAIEVDGTVSGAGVICAIYAPSEEFFNILCMCARVYVRACVYVRVRMCARACACTCCMRSSFSWFVDDC